MKKLNLVIFGLSSLCLLSGCSNKGTSSSAAASSQSSVVSSQAASSEQGNWNSAFTKVELNPISKEGVTLVNSGKLTVATSTDFAPYEFVDLTKQGQDKYVGSDMCLAQAIANALGVELYIKAMDFSVTCVALDNGIADIAISGISYKTDRATSYLYTNCYYSEGDGGQVVIINKKNAEKYTTLASLNKTEIKIAAQNGALQVDLVEGQLANATLVKVDDLNAEYDALAAGSVDGIAIAENVANALIAKYPDTFAIVQEHFNYKDSGEYALVKKGNTALKTAVDGVIDQIVEKGIYSTWVSEAETLFSNLGNNAGEVIPEEE